MTGDMPAGVTYDTDDSLPGPVLRLTGQSLIIRDSIFSDLVNSAPSSLILEKSSVTIINTTFQDNSQVQSEASNEISRQTHSGLWIEPLMSASLHGVHGSGRPFLHASRILHLQWLKRISSLLVLSALRADEHV